MNFFIKKRHFCIFFSAFSFFIWLYEKKTLPLHQKSKNTAFMSIYLLQEQYHSGSSRVVYASERLTKVEDIIREKYGLNDEDVRHFLEWKEFYNVCEDIKIFFEDIELDKFVQL